MSIRGISVCLTVMALSGCVQRFLVIDSEPSGASVVFDGFPVGETPQRIPFEHYGTHEILLRHARTTDEQTGEVSHYRSRSELVKIGAPWYQIFPLDLLAELWPGRVVDERRIRFVLETYDPAAELEDFEVEARRRGVEIPGKGEN